MSRALLLVACSTSMTGCILRDFDYQDPANFPPSVESIPNGPAPLNRVLDVDLLLPPNDLTFAAEIRDPDVGQDLRGRVYLNFDPVFPSLGYMKEITPAEFVPDPSDPSRRRVDFSLFRTSFTRGCHLVELLVSSELQAFPIREPVLGGDIGTGSWWIYAHEGDETVDMASCSREVR